MAFHKAMEIQQWNKKDALFEGVLDPVYKTLDYCDVFYVLNKGFAVLNHAPRYALYKRLGIPEIQDIFVIESARKQGVATALIKHCETIAKTDMVGISVPVSTQFGAAQRLYYKLGYVPDGNGVTYDRTIVPYGAAAPVDENLCLMMIKELS